MANKPHTITTLLDDLGPGKGLCAFNVETFDTLHPVFQAAAQTACPVVIAYSVPAARYLGYPTIVALVELIASNYGEVAYALHLDHCENPDELRAAAAAGFTSANFLDEGAIAPGSYLATAQALHTEFGGRVSLEFVLGQLGHIDSPHAPTEPTTVEAIERFAEACSPDILGFDCGSVHGMRDRTQPIDTDLIRAVSAATALPIVLHGSSGVTPEQLRAGIDAGIAKVNIETAVRATYMAAVRAAISGDGDAARKPRRLTEVTDEVLRRVYSEFLLDYTLRKK